MNPQAHPPPVDNRSVNAELFGAGLKRAAGAAVRVSASAGAGGSFCTGWLVAPQLVVVPAYLLADDRMDVAVRSAPGRCGEADWEDHSVPDEAAEHLRAEIDGPPPAAMDLAIVRLAGAHAAPRLAYRRVAPEAHDLLLSVHHGVFGTEPREAYLSFAELLGWNEATLHYQGSGRPGSGGAVLYDKEWRFLGLHLIRAENSASGLAQATVMAMLQRSRWWREIAAHQGLADVVAVREAIDGAGCAPPPAPPPVPAVAVKAALSFAVVPDTLAPDERASLAPWVVDAGSSRWTMHAATRRQVLADIPFGQLAAHLPELDPADRRVVGAILHGDMGAIEDAGEDDLARWLQAVRWFAGLAPGLPAPARIFQLLQRRRLRGRLGRIASDDFVGRGAELALMRRWFDERSRAPLSVWGMGGVGKSALVARFLASLPPETMLLWLDFDEAALAPDDAASVIAALHEQALPQLDGEAAAAQEGAAADDAEALAGLLAAQPARRIVVVLDSFEAAQYAERYQELWPVLEALGARVDGMGVIVSGRAPVPKLRLHGSDTIEIRLEGLDPGDSRAWLGRHRVPAGPVQEEVVRLADGSPLVLRLAERLIEAGGRLDRLPQDLPGQMIAGVLYERILDRVHNAEFRNLAQGAIVLRRLSAEMVEPVFGGLPLVLPAGPASAWFPEFAREAALVEGQEEVRLRPEVRAAALSLLERQEPALVRAIDRRALDWYGGRDTTDPAVAAERVYHALRLGDEAAAGEAWREGCGNYLAYAGETLRDGARDWLEQRLGTSASIFGAGVAVWELEAADRIAQSRAAGLPASASGILREREERSVGGALAFHEAYQAWVEGRRDAALAQLLAHGVAPGDRQTRERAMLAALIRHEQGEVAAACALLDAWSGPQHWDDRQEGLAERAAVHAAQVCMLACLPLEDRLAAGGAWPEQVLPMDVLREESQAVANAGARHAGAYRIGLPLATAERERFLESLARLRQKSLLREWAPLQAAELRSAWYRAAHPGTGLANADPVTALLKASWRRWSILAEGAMARVLDEALAVPAINPLDRSVITVLALFAGIPGVELDVDGKPLDTLLSHMRSRLSAAPGELRAYQGESGVYGSRAYADVQGLRRRALAWCGSEPRPLRQLVQRFAGRIEEG